LVGWLAGPDANENSDLNENEFLEKAIVSLAEIFKIGPEYFYNKLKSHKVYNWIKDPFSRGAYSYCTMTTRKAVKFLNRPLLSTLYFAGEAFAKSGTATVEAALQSGKEVAEKILKRR
jgi:monoamine oxidase